MKKLLTMSLILASAFTTNAFAARLSCVADDALSITADFDTKKNEASNVQFFNRNRYLKLEKPFIDVNYDAHTGEVFKLTLRDYKKSRTDLMAVVANNQFIDASGAYEVLECGIFEK